MVQVSKRFYGELVQCTKCFIEKPWTEKYFIRDAGKLRNPCIKCASNSRKIRYEKDPNRKEKSKARTAKYRKNNPDKVFIQNRKPRKINKELANKRVNRWKKNNPESGRIQASKRKCMKLDLPHFFTKKDWHKCLEYWNHKCCICGRKEGEGYVLSQDHWIALSDTRENNPGTVPTNMLPMCHARKGVNGGCNNSKWIKDGKEWLMSKYGTDFAEKKNKRNRTLFQLSSLKVGRFKI